MQSQARSRFGGIVLAVAAFGSACSSSFGPNNSHVSAAVVDHFGGLPWGQHAPPESRAADVESAAVIRRDAHSIYVVTWGSGSCPDIPTSVRTIGPDRLSIRTVQHSFWSRANACTLDLAPTTSVVRLPASLVEARSLVVVVDGKVTRLTAD
jgi:hypothetical protein